MMSIRSRHCLPAGRLMAACDAVWDAAHEYALMNPCAHQATWRRASMQFEAYAILFMHNPEIETELHWIAQAAWSLADAGPGSYLNLEQQRVA